MKYQHKNYSFTVDYTLDNESHEAERDTAYIIGGMQRYLHSDDVEQAEFERDKVTFYNGAGEVVAIARRVLQ